MRKIKFRVWDGHTKSYMHKDKETHYLPRVVIDEETGDTTLVGVDDRYDIQLYTGLTDKNGKEIYEGDVVEYKYGPVHGRGVVRWINHGFWIDESGTGAECYMPTERRVIGNIYSNPDLIPTP